MTTVLANGGIERFDDFHVDDIDAVWGARDRWLEASLQSLRLASDLRDELHTQVVPAIGMSLQSVEDGKARILPALPDVVEDCDQSPPSLYLFRLGQEPWHGDADFRRWPVVRPLNYPRPLDGFLREWWDADERMLHRSLFLVEQQP